MRSDRGGHSVGRVDREAVEREPLLCFNPSQQSVGFVQVPCINGFLRLALQSNNIRTIAGQRRRAGQKDFVTLCNLNELSGQQFGRNVGLADNIKCAPHLPFIEVQFFFEESDILSLLSGQLLQRARPVTNKRIHFFLGEADIDC